VQERYDAPPPVLEAVHGIAVGKVVGMNAAGAALVQVPLLGGEVRMALCAADVDLSHHGVEVALAFEGADARKPIILGVMQPSSWEVAARTTGQCLETVIDGHRRVLVRAGQEIELRCGEASILLTTDGRIHLRGKTIVSEADTSNRILGASISMN
jgi:hypothetical protein